MLLIVFISFVLFNYRIASKISNHSFDEILITGFTIQTGSIIISGYLLSFFLCWHSAIAWSILPFCISYLLYILFKNLIYLPDSSHHSSFKLIGSSIQQLHELFKQQRKTEKVLFAFIFIGILVIGCFQIFIMFKLPPNEWDSMTGHLNRILYFNQNHSTSHFIGTNWNIDTYPKSFSSVQFYPFLMGDFNEHLFKLPNLSAYWMLFIGFYASIKQLKIPFKTRLLSACLVLFTPIILIQSTSTDTDIVLASYLISSIYFLFRYANSKEPYYIYLFVFVFAIGLSHKITWVFSIPSLFVLLIYVRSKTKEIKLWIQLKHLCISGIFIIIITLPTGYIANIKYYHHPIGPKTATQHQSIERAGNMSSLLINGSRNTLRYTFDLLNFDGLQNIPSIEKCQHFINDQFRKVDRKLNLGLEKETQFTIIPFSFNRQFEFVNGTPIYGAIFLFLLIPSIVLLLFTKQNKFYYYLFSAFVLHFFALAYTAAYDPWKGRYMISSLMYILPVTSILFNKIVMGKKYIYILPIYLFVIASAWATLLYHGRGAIISTHNLPTIWSKSRMELLTISRPDIAKAYSRFDKIVPQDATVALATINDDYEYPLWGNNFTRKLIPINPFEQGLQAIPVEANYLFFSKNVITPIAGDIRLGTDTTMKEHIIVRGEDYYLRKLK